MTPLVVEMETGDPDDFLTLLLALCHPEIDLKAVVLNPGTPDQIGLVEEAFRRCGKAVPIGAYDIDNKNKRVKPSVSTWHYETMSWTTSRNAQEGWRVLDEHLTPDTTMFVGAPPRNLGELLKHKPDKEFKELVVQGGFAGDSVLEESGYAYGTLPKFKGMEKCRTFNLNGHKASTNRILAWNGPKRFVSKNVCHGVLYDEEFHSKLRADYKKMSTTRHRAGLENIWSLMDKSYIERKTSKALHDPFALCCIIDPWIARWAEVDLFSKGGEWGCKMSPGSNTKITVLGVHDSFYHAMTKGKPKL